MLGITSSTAKPQQDRAKAVDETGGTSRKTHLRSKNERREKSEWEKKYEKSP